MLVLKTNGMLAVVSIVAVIVAVTGVKTSIDPVPITGFAEEVITVPVALIRIGFAVLTFVPSESFRLVVPILAKNSEFCDGFLGD